MRATAPCKTDDDSVVSAAGLHTARFAIEESAAIVLPIGPENLAQKEHPHLLTHVMTICQQTNCL